MAQDYTKKIMESAEMQTPNTVSTEVQETLQANSVRPQMATPQTTPQQNTSQSNNIQPTQNNTSNVQKTPEYQSAYTISQQNIMNQAQSVQPVQNQSSTTIKIPTDLYDRTVEAYLEEYNKGKEINDYQAQINALNGIDQYRVSQGYKQMYTSNVYELTNQRTEKIKNQIRDYETDIATAINEGDQELAQQIGQRMEEYKRMVNYNESLNNSASYLENLEYKFAYDNVVNGIIDELLTAKFTYNPNDDEALLRAQQYATNTVYESMNSKGILDSTMTSAIVTKTVNELIPVYEKMAKEEFYENIDRLQTMANFIMNIDDRQYERWANQVQLKLDYYEAKREEVAYQWERVENLGYVDNEASIILGVAPGTMSPSMRKAIQEADQEATSQYNKLLTDIKLAQAKADLEIQTYASKKAIDNAYKNTSNSSNKTSDSTTKYDSNISDSDKKKIIKSKYKNGEISELEAVKEIYNNFESKKIGGMLSDILDITEKEAEELLNNGYANELLASAFDTYGEITDENVGYFDKYALDLFENELIDETTMEEMLTVIDQGLAYNTLKNDYIAMMDSRIRRVKKLSEKELEKEDFSRTTVDASLEEKLGKVYYNKLEELVKEKEKELTEALKEKGIDW